MKLVVQIPCYNEAEQLPATLARIPRTIPGVSEVVSLVVDDGSRDATVEVARAAGADLVLELKRHRGLAATFQAGLDASLRRGGDVVVTIDADGQFDPRDIPELLAPLVTGDADITVGDRDVRHVPYFSRRKRLLQRTGSALVRRASGTNIRDPTSGFRAYSWEAALQTEVLCGFTYTLDTLIRAGRAGLAIRDVSVATEPAPRPSRLYSSVCSYVRRAGISICRSRARYAPLRFFLPGAAAALSVAAVIGAAGRTSVPALLAGTVIGMVAACLSLTGMLAWLVAGADRLGDSILLTVRRIELTGRDFATKVPVADQSRIGCETTNGAYDTSPAQVSPGAPCATTHVPHEAG